MQVFCKKQSHYAIFLDVIKKYNNYRAVALDVTSTENILNIKDLKKM